jgi:hypothetical protein
MKLNSLLLVIALILVGAIGFEVFLYVKSTPELANQPALSTKPTSSDFCFSQEVDDCLAMLLPQKNPNQAVSENVLKSLRVLKKEVTKQATIDYRLEGELSQVKQSPNPNNPFLFFSIKNGKYSNSFNLPEKSLIIVKKTDQTKQTAADLQKGMKVTFVRKWDLINNQTQKNQLIIN